MLPARPSRCAVSEGAGSGPTGSAHRIATGVKTALRRLLPGSCAHHVNDGFGAQSGIWLSPVPPSPCSIYNFSQLEPFSVRHFRPNYGILCRLFRDLFGSSNRKFESRSGRQVIVVIQDLRECREFSPVSRAFAARTSPETGILIPRMREIGALSQSRYLPVRS